MSWARIQPQVLRMASRAPILGGRRGQRRDLQFDENGIGAEVATGCRIRADCDAWKGICW